MNRRTTLILLVFVFCCTIGFIFLSNNNLSQFIRVVIHDKSSTIDRDVSCNTSIDSPQFRRCLTQHRDDTFWSVQSIRHTAFKGLLNSSSLIIEIGGNTGLDTSKFVQLYNPFIISFEPLVQMAKDLRRKFQRNRKVEIQPYGLGNRVRTISIEPFGDTSNTGTSMFRQLPTKNSSKLEQIQILDIVEVIRKIQKERTIDGMIDLISINCEGCEFEVLPALILHNMTQYFRSIQFASHMDVLHGSSCIYCQIEQELQRTHSIKYRYVMLWEAWIFNR